MVPSPKAIFSFLSIVMIYQFETLLGIGEFN